MNTSIDKNNPDLKEAVTVYGYSIKHAVELKEINSLF